jgi:hypothetical protein
MKRPFRLQASLECLAAECSPLEVVDGRVWTMTHGPSFGDPEGRRSAGHSFEEHPT